MRLRLFVAAAGLAVFPSRAHADTQTWDWSYSTSTPATESYSGSGTLTTDFVSDDTYVVTGITGMINGEDITGVLQCILTKVMIIFCTGRAFS